MKKVYLLGDSIRMGYEPFVRQKMTGLADIFSPSENCKFAQFTLRYLHEWAEKINCQNEIDLVHWNNGLWDVLHQFEDECLTPPGYYADTLKRIYKRIRIVFPNAKIIFALSTPVIEEKFNLKNLYRINRDIIEYNDIASQIMKELDVPVNDLFAAAGNFTAVQYSDATHFTEEGYEILANAVVEFCESHLKNK